MVKRTIFRKQIFRDTAYDYIYITYREAIERLSQATKTGEVVKIQDVMEYLSSDIDTAISVMGYMYHNGLLFQRSGTEYVCDYTNLVLSDIVE